MISLSKSFVLGVLVASVTWTISLLLYWNLTQGTDSGSSAAAAALHGFSQQSVADVTSHSAELIIRPVDNFVETVVNGPSKHLSRSKDLYLEKLRRLEKDKNRRKISQHLADEFRPQKVEILGMKHKIRKLVFNVNVIHNSQMNLD